MKTVELPRWVSPRGGCGGSFYSAFHDQDAPQHSGFFTFLLARALPFTSSVAAVNVALITLVIVQCRRNPTKEVLTERTWQPMRMKAESAVMVILP